MQARVWTDGEAAEAAMDEHKGDGDVHSGAPGQGGASLSVGNPGQRGHVRGVNNDEGPTMTWPGGGARGPVHASLSTCALRGAHMSLAPPTSLACAEQRRVGRLARRPHPLSRGCNGNRVGCPLYAPRQPGTALPVLDLTSFRGRLAWATVPARTRGTPLTDDAWHRPTTWASGCQAARRVLALMLMVMLLRLCCAGLRAWTNRGARCD